MEQVAEQVEPLGPDRDDMRDSRNTTQIVASLCSGLSESDLSSISEGLRYYLAVNQPKEARTLTPKEAAALEARRNK